MTALVPIVSVILALIIFGAILICIICKCKSNQSQQEFPNNAKKTYTKKTSLSDNNQLFFQGAKGITKPDKKRKISDKALKYDQPKTQPITKVPLEISIMEKVKGCQKQGALYKHVLKKNIDKSRSFSFRRKRFPKKTSDETIHHNIHQQLKNQFNTDSNSQNTYLPYFQPSSKTFKKEILIDFRHQDSSKKHTGKLDLSKSALPTTPSNEDIAKFALNFSLDETEFGQKSKDKVRKLQEFSMKILPELDASKVNSKQIDTNQTEQTQIQKSKQIKKIQIFQEEKFKQSKENETSFSRIISRKKEKNAKASEVYLSEMNFLNNTHDTNIMNQNYFPQNEL